MTDDVATCPHCGSTSIQAVPIESKRIGQAILAEHVMSTAAGVSAGRAMVIQAICLKCGAQWFPGSAQEERMRALSGQLGREALARAESAQRAEEQVARWRDRENVIIGLLVLIVFALVFFVAVRGSQ